METPEKVDLVWSAQGTRLRADHGYALYASLSRVVPALHGASWLAIHGMRGSPDGQGLIHLGKRPVLTLRLPPEQIGVTLGLAGQKLDVEGHTLVVGVPTIRQLQPASAVTARAVVVRLTTAPRGLGGKLDLDAFRDAFAREASRQIERLGVSGTLEVGRHREIRVQAQRIIGFSVTVRGLTPEHSLLLQTRGIGGKQRMGCGIFLPVRPPR